MRTMRDSSRRIERKSLGRVCRAISLAAGMDDFLAKPIAAAALWAVLERAIQPAPYTAGPQPAGNAPG